MVHLHGHSGRRGHPESNEDFVETRRGGRVRHTSPDRGAAVVNNCLFISQKFSVLVSGMQLSLVEHVICTCREQPSSKKSFFIT